jgi:hypothetical protein
MGTSITVSTYLLEDIFRLLEYLNTLSDHDELHFHKSGYSLRLEHDNTLWELKIKIRQLQGRIVETYLLTVGDITEDERRDLLEWVAAGKSVYDNPCLIYDDSGRPMDFINACRLDLEMAENPSDFFSERLDTVEDGGWDDELPF